jgi:hypothetical protein
MSDLPELPDEVVDELIDLDPAEFASSPTADPDKLTIRSLDPMREWLRDVRAGKTILAVHDIPDDVLDRNLENIIGDFRSQGVDIRDRRQLLTCALVWQTSMVALMHDLEHCGSRDPGDIAHVYVHMARPLLNMALAFELLILAEFGDEAALLPEGGD